MKNLVVERDLCAQLHLAEDGPVASFCINAAESRLYAITLSSVVACYTLSETLTLLWRVPLGAELLVPDHEADDLGAVVPPNSSAPPTCWLTSFSHVLELDCLCVATRGGAIALLHVGEGETPALEQVGNIDGGVVCLEWSPDGELLAVLSGSGNLLVMNQAWDLLHEGPALGSPAAVAGTAAAAAPLLPLSSAEQARVYGDGRISWRGDGKFFAVVVRDPTAASAAAVAAAPAAGAAGASGAASGVDAVQALPPYRVRIWDRTTLEPHAWGEPAEGLAALPAWQPNGRHLYVAAAAATAATVAAGAPAPASAAISSGGGGSGSGAGPAVLMYERNGLRHGGLKLPSQAPVVSLAWSCDSELLSVVTAPYDSSGTAGGEEANGSEDWVVQLWHRSNWHWYLKHERRYRRGLGAAARLPPQLRWDEQRGGVVHVVTPAGAYEQVALAWDTCVSGRGTVVVVDGARLLLTPLRHGLVPPPMCSAAVQLPEAAVDVAVAALPASTSASTAAAGGAAAEAAEADEVVAALTSSGRLVVARAVEEDLWLETVEDQEALAAESSTSPAPSSATVTATAAAAPPPPLRPAAPRLDVPLAGGRRARALTWLAGASSLLVLAAPYPEAELEEGAGDVLVQVDVEWLSCGPADPANPAASPEVRLTERLPVYAGGRVLRMAPHAAGGAALQLASGAVLRFAPGATSLSPCGPRAALPAPCPVVRSVPAEALAALAATLPPGQAPAPLLGLSRGGMLCWGSLVIAASDVTSLAVRAYGPGGPALLYTSRKNLLYTVLMSQLPVYTHRDLVADPLSFRSAYKREGDVQAAMHAAMRPDAATAASRDVVVRAVEAGAALVACPAGEPRPGGGWRLADVPAVLQMPRGNLEGVSPRALVLSALVGALRRADYGEAWRLASVQRVDLNLLVDYSWPAFLSHAAAFVSAVPRPSDLCDLLFALRPGSVLHAADGGAYASALAMLGELSTQPLAALQQAQHAQQQGRQQAGQQQKGPPHTAAGAADGGSAGANVSSKVSAVCGAVREVVLALPDSRQYLEVVVTSYARSDPPQLEAAMRSIRDAKERELTSTSNQQGTSSSSSSSNDSSATAAAASTSDRPMSAQVSATAPTGGAGGGVVGPADKALKHLLLYVDADELYNTALGMYDMPLAYMVVVNAQKDPGEYLSELQRFASITPPPLQRHAVDMHLRRYPSALTNLVAAGGQHFAQALHLARERGLLRQLLQLYDEDPEHRPAVLDAYGDQLEAAKRFDDAAVTFLAAGKAAKALRAYRAGGRWRMVFVVAGQLEYDEEAVQALAAEVAEELAAGGQVADAAAVLLGYLQDVDNAVRTYAQAREWREAVRVAHAHQRSDLVETVVAPAAAEGAAALLAEAGESAERIRKYGQRLADVRGRRLAMAAAVAAADEDGAAAGLPADDAQSDVMSMVSGLSVYTDATHTAAGGTHSGSASSRAPSTVGGRKAHRDGKKLNKAGARIRQGSPLEEASLVSHVHGLAPRPAQLEEAAQLGELLVLLGHAADARTLQRAVAAWQVAYQEARADIAAHPIPVDGPGHARAELERLLAPAPDTATVAWKWDVLRDFERAPV